MEGVTTAIVLFVFACVILPSLVKNRTQFYAAFFALLLILLLHSLRLMLYNSPGFLVASGAIVGLLQLVAIVMLFLSAGGITVKEFGGDMARAIEVIRRGEEEKEIIIPRSDTASRGSAGDAPAGSPTPRRSTDDEDERRVEKLDLPAGAEWPAQPPSSSPNPPAPAEPERARGTIPLE